MAVPKTETEEGWANMAWTWQYHGAEGAGPVEEGLPSESFTSRGDAETWLGENWEELAQGGVIRVTLLEGDTEAYTMSLEPAGD